MRINQPCVNTDAVARALDTAFHDVGDAKLPADLGQIARDSAPVMFRRGAADYLQVRDLGEVGQDFVLHAVCEVSVLLIVA
jgi:hypothetical protein